MSKPRKLKKIRKITKRKMSARHHKEQLKKRLAQSGMEDDYKLVHDPQGEVKMSDVLLTFIDPYVHLADNDEAYERLLRISILAWNMALLPEENREEKIDELLSQALPPESFADAKAVVAELIERKLSYFPDLNRFILDYELTDLGNDQNHLSVVSTLSQPSFSA